MPRNREYDYDDDDDEDEDEPRQPLEGDKLVRHLRRQVKDRDKKLSEATAKITEFEKRDRRESIAAVLKAAEVDERYARWVVRDLDDTEPTKENIQKWLDENADLVGVKRTESTVDEDTQRNLQRIQGADRGAKGADADPIAAKLTDPALSPADLEALIGKSLVA